MNNAATASAQADIKQKAIAAAPIWFGNLVQKYIKETYPTGVALVCSPDDDGMFEKDLLEEAFGYEATKDICSDLADICVIPFQGATVWEVRDALVAAALNDGYIDDEELSKDLDNMYTIYENGEPIVKLPA